MASYKQTHYEVLHRHCVAFDQQGWKQITSAQAQGLTPGRGSLTLTKFRLQCQLALTWQKPAVATARLTENQLTEPSTN